jgi:hypothetical protein
MSWQLGASLVQTNAAAQCIPRKINEPAGAISKCEEADRRGIALV